MRQNHLIIIFLLVFSTIAALFSGCTKAEDGPRSQIAPDSTAATPTPEIPATTPLVRTLTVREAFDLIQENKDNKDFRIIDVRTKDEYDGGHIATAVNIDYYSPDFRARVDNLDRSKRYLVYCRTGVRSAAASQILADLGFREIYNLGDGINRWIQDGYPVVR